MRRWWGLALRNAGELRELRRENAVLRREHAQLVHRCEVLSDKLDRARRDMAIVRLCARDRDAVDEFLASAEGIASLPESGDAA